MSQLLFGSRGDAVDRFKNQPATELKFFSEKDEFDPATTNGDFHMLWDAHVLPMTTFVFVDPPKAINPTGLRKRADRVVVFSGNPPAAWKKWAEKAGIEVVDLTPPDPAAVVRVLVKGLSGCPRLTPEAAEHVVACNPGGAAALRPAMEALVLCEFPEGKPLTLEQVFEVWPFVIHEGKTYSVNLGFLLKTLGSKDAIAETVKSLPDESYGTLMGLKTACKRTPDRLQLLEPLIKGVDSKRWTPKAALVLFAHLCYLHGKWTKWPSSTKGKPSVSPALTRLYSLCGIP